jgi:colanic acid biosynthesis glycosyl transferase WcaI
VSTISGRMVERLLSKGVQQKKARYFPNWVDLNRIRPSANPAYRTQLGIGSAATVVLFSGTLGGKQGLTVIPAAARVLAERHDILFVICGDGVMKPTLQEAAADLSNVIFMPLQPLGRLADLLSMADIHLLPQSPDAADLVLPSKLSGMLASGRPVVATCQSGTEIAEIVSQCGLVVAPEDSQELARAVVELADHRNFRLDLGRRARGLAEARFGRDAVLGEMFNSLTETEGAPITTDIPA